MIARWNLQAPDGTVFNFMNVEGKIVKTREDGTMRVVALDWDGMTLRTRYDSPTMVVLPLVRPGKP
jgi:hypothetical protein